MDRSSQNNNATTRVPTAKSIARAEKRRIAKEARLAKEAAVEANIHIPRIARVI